MSYENAPATRMVATDCACCGRPLLDAESVELGIGPVCRRRHGYFDPVDPDFRQEANRLVHEAACVQHTDPKRLLAISDQLTMMGLGKLAAIMADRFIPVKLTDTRAKRFRWDAVQRREIETGDEIEVIEVVAPYHPEFNEHVRKLGYKRPVRGEDGKFRCWQVGAADRRALLGILSVCYPRLNARGAKGVFQIPTFDEFQREFKTPRMRPAA